MSTAADVLHCRLVPEDECPNKKRIEARHEEKLRLYDMHRLSARVVYPKLCRVEDRCKDLSEALADIEGALVEDGSN